MLSLLVVSLIAGLCVGQHNNEFSDCDTAPDIITQCATDYLDYVKDANQGHYVQMQNLAVISLPNIVLPMLDTICNDKMKLKAYYYCAFLNVTYCLDNKNSTQSMDIPDANNIADGIVELCKGKEDMNRTCLMTSLQDVIGCFGKFSSDNEDAKTCEVYEGRISCAEENLNSCDGDEDVKKFLVDARPRTCEDTSSVPQFLPSVLLLAGTLLVHFFRMQ